MPHGGELQHLTPGKQRGAVLIGNRSGIGEHMQHLRILEHRGDALGRIGRIDGQVGRAGLPDAEHGGEQRGATGDADGDAGVALHAVAQQPLGDGRSPVKQFTIREAFLLTGKGNGIRSARTGLCNTLAHWHKRITRKRHRLARRRTHCQRAQATRCGIRLSLGTRRQLIEQLDIPQRQPFDARLVEPQAVPFPFELERGLRHDHQRQRIVRATDRLHGAHAQAVARIVIAGYIQRVERGIERIVFEHEQAVE
ncbi:hypothetical protein R69658_02670 [Paraburkholderia aspalathi]|uniref:Uncharacterized protein n=1 Tax=Paraburkholderia aspalathi TaxID=1324617 RepID=A0ABM8RFP2_9BURK|nr:hypothetical protein R69658_02670 [Paraburkholderia aspalathi]